jgi:hypothetical protein
MTCGCENEGGESCHAGEDCAVIERINSSVDYVADLEKKMVSEGFRVPGKDLKDQDVCRELLRVVAAFAQSVPLNDWLAVEAEIMTGLQEAMDLLCEAMREERKRISEELYEMQGTVSQFATSKECIAYNRALREAAEKIIAGDS